ncbi:uncharacterized protein [Venturia canescens]|uniref:uncharacterized protein n=1 Tax=Venturia canescens TaxID=32260 RepID=UPI001C9CBBC7|nr:uncharacterized protein LOC122416807 [Venturia canescens]
MKKRRLYTRNQNCSSINSLRAGIHSAASDTNPLRSKSSQDFKRRRSCRVKQSRRPKEDNRSLKFTGLKKKDAFGSLESLFDVKRPLQIPDASQLSHRLTTDENSNSESDVDVKNPKPFIVSLYEKAAVVEQEPNILVETWRSSEPVRKPRISALEELERDIIDENSDEVSNVDESSASESASNDEMAEEDRKKSSVSEAPELRSSEAPAQQKEDKLSAEAAPLQNETKRSTFGKIKNAVVDKLRNKSDSLKSPRNSSQVGEGKLDGQRDSVMSSTPLTDSEVIKEMAEAEKRCKIVAQEIKATKDQISELKHKENLTDEDTKMIQEKQASLLKKMQEFDEITKNIQRVVGLSDPSNRTFAKMFDMLQNSHTKSSIPEEGEAEIEKKPEEKSKKVLDSEKYFALPEPEYPEDELPRAIICGFTEDKIPKIVIPDSRPKGASCLQNLTGKLSESLNMQEKLVQENAKLEGGRYKLEEALLEKDNTLDSLVRKVCSLQSEMRIVVKENTELNRQLASLSNSQRSGGAPSGCCSVTPANNSPRSTNRQQSSYSYRSSPRRDDESCCCRRCLEGQSELGTRQTSTVCVNPESFNAYQRSCPASPRLSGGGSKDGYYYPGPGAEQNSVMCCRAPAGGKVPGTGGRSCPAETQNRSADCGNSTKQLAQQLGSMESEIRNMQMELANVHRERQQLEQQRKLLKCTGPCAPCSCCPPGSFPVSGPAHQPMMVPCLAGSSLPSNQQGLPDDAMSYPGSVQQPKMTQHQDPTSCSGVCTIAPMGASTCPQQQLRDLREQYARLQEDYKNKLTEVSCMRTEMDKMKQDAREAKEERGRAESRLSEIQERMKIAQTDKSRFHGSREQAVEQEQALLVAKQRYREAQDELEELRSLIQDQANQLEDYRNKYLQAQELVEEQRRQLELMEMDNARMNENVNLEIGRVKNQFKEKLAELAPLPDILKQTQAKLQEVQQMRLIAERNCEDLSRELLTCKEKLNALSTQFTMMKSENSTLHDEKGLGSGRCDELEKKVSELKSENERMKSSIVRFEEQEFMWEQRVEEKTHEIVQLTALLEEVREDSARQVARTKERCETVRRTMQGQISEMEKQLAQCRATARAAQKDRDEIRQKMQGQINNLMEAFEQAQGRIRSLQGHVNYLKTSYSNIFNPSGQGEPSMGYMQGDTTGQGYDSCDCNY